jgi:CubicO group peptidase (beta-lactamase class C family)
MIGFLVCVALCRAAEIRPAVLDEIIEKHRKALDVPGVAVAIVHGDETVYIKGFGVKRIGEPDPVTPDTRFAICSTTKAFTTAAMAILVDEGKMAWDDPVKKHIPYFKLSDPLADANVTMRDIVCHRTGFLGADILYEGSFLSREEVTKKVGLQPMSGPFRSVYLYSNTLFIVAGEAVGRIAGTTWEDFVARRLLGPLGMTHTDFRVTEAVKSPDHATPHVRRSEKWEPVAWRNLYTAAPAGGINSSVRDLTRWLRLHLNKGVFEGKVVIKEASLRETHAPQMLYRNAPNAINEAPHMTATGLGWNIQDYRGHFVVFHPGASIGFSSQVILVPDQRYGIAILCNSSGGLPEFPAVLRSAILDELLGLTAKDRIPAILQQQRQAAEQSKKRREESEQKRRKDTTPSLDAKSYVGSYEDAIFGGAEVREKDGRLELHWNNWRLPLEHYERDGFRTGDSPIGDVYVYFRVSNNERVESFRLFGRNFVRSVDQP